MMITLENYLHDIHLIKKNVIQLFEIIKEKYNFCNSEFKRIPDTNENLTVAIQKNKLIIYCYITRREAYELMFRNNEWQNSKHEGIAFFENNYFNNKNEKEFYLRNIYKESLAFEKYSYEWYDFLIGSEINFVETHFSDVFIEGNWDISIR